MARIRLSNSDLVALIDDEGEVWLRKFTWFVDVGYARRAAPRLPGAGRANIHMHMEIWEHHFGKPPTGFKIDHANRNKLDNRKENLRLATQSQNMANRNKDPRNKSGFMGVSRCASKNCWAANVRHEGKKHWAGYHATPEGAALARDRLVIKLGARAPLNFPSPGRKRARGP